MADKTTLATAGNVLIPAYLALLEKGFTVRAEKTGTEHELWFAENNSQTFIAEEPLSLLGLVCLWETRGENWQASDGEIDDFLNRYET